MTRLRESGITRVGTVIVFIIVALVLAGLVWAGYNFVQQRGEQVRRDEATEIARQNLEDQSDTPIIAQEDTDDEAEQAPKPSPTPSTGSGATNTDKKEAEKPAAVPATSTTPAAMPATGPESVQFLGLALLTLATAMFVASRKAVRQL